MSEHKNRLNSWKEIAAYVGYDESTVRRWEKNSNLPVHRVGGSKGASVYAYSEEIDGWLRKSANPTVSNALNESAASQAPVENPKQDLIATLEPSAKSNINLVPERGHFSIWKAVASACLIVSAIVFAAWLWLRKPSRPSYAAPSGAVSDSAKAADNKMSDVVPEETAFEVKKLVKESQVWEMLSLYVEPWVCDANDLRYWAPGSKALFEVVESVSRLNERDVHYGFGAKLLDFEFRYIRIARDGLSAEVGTREHWWLPVVKRDGTRVASRNPDQGPYEIEYLLVKLDGRWYLKSTSTPYTGWKPKQITCKNWHFQVN